MRSTLLSSSLRTREVPFQRSGYSHLDVIHEFEERDDIFGQTFPQAVHSSSPILSPDCSFRSSDVPLSQSSATSVSEVFHDGIWKDPSSSFAGNPESMVVDQFAQDLHGRLVKLSKEREITSFHIQEHPPSTLLSSQTQSSSTRSSTTLSIRRRDSIVHFQFKRTKSDGFSLTSRPPKSLYADNSDSITRKRTRPSVSFDVHSPHLSADFPESKKRRLLRHATADSHKYATRTASFRRALSLRSQSSIPEKPRINDNIIQVPSQNAESHIRSTLDLPSPPGWIPTVPCSPEPEHPVHATPLRLARNYRDPRFDPDLLLSPGPATLKVAGVSQKQTRALPSKVPIIAPPPDHTYSTPLSEASQAKLRLVRFREREQRMRESDLAMLRKPANVLASDAPSTLAAEISSVMSENQGHTQDIEMYVEGDDEIDQLEIEDCRVCCASFRESSGYHHGMGNRMISWILEVLPSPSLSSQTHSNSSSSSSSRTNSSSQTSASNDPNLSFRSMNSSIDSSNEVCPSKRLSDLTDQLLDSPETRFHAAYLFMRFFHLVLGAAQESSANDNDQSASETALEAASRKFSWDIKGSELVMWDIAVGCLALSVKLHRDFLPPLYPIFSSDYEALAPHNMGYGDLETAQRDILFALSYNLGSTPQAILDDLWNALPSLRELLNFDEGWSLVLQETWLILFEAVSESEIMNFSLSLLTASAVIEGLVSALVRRYQAQDPWYERFRRRRLSIVKKQRTETETGLLTHERQGLSSYTKSSVRISLRRTSSSSSTSLSSNDTEATSTIDTSDNRQSDTHGGDEFAIRKAKERVRRAKIESEGVMLDIQAALGIADDQLKACRKWISPFVGDRW